MQVRLQDCECVALPHHVAASLGLEAGFVLNLSCHEVSRSLTLTVVSRRETRPEASGASCIVGQRVR